MGTALLDRTIDQYRELARLNAEIEQAVYRGDHESIDRLVDRACDPDTVAAMRETMQRTPGVVRVDDIKSRLFGSRTYVDAEIAVDGALPLRDAHVIAEAVHHELERDYPDVKHCTVHVNPA